MKTFARLKRILFAAPILLLLLTMQGCVHYYYGPNSNNMPLLKGKGDVNISGGLAVSGDGHALSNRSSGFELQSAFGLSNHVGAMVNFYSASGGEKTTNSGGSTPNYKDNGSGSYIEGGLGYFTTVNSSDVIFEVYGGVGKGSVTNNYSLGETSKVSVQKLFLQPSIGFIIGPGLEFGLASRFSSVQIKPTLNTIHPDSHDYDAVDELARHTNHFFWEPGFLIRGGSKQVKFQLQWTYSKEKGRHAYITQRGVLALGMLFTLPGSGKI